MTCIGTSFKYSKRIAQNLHIDPRQEGFALPIVLFKYITLEAIYNFNPKLHMIFYTC